MHRGPNGGRTLQASAWPLRSSALPFDAFAQPPGLRPHPLAFSWHHNAWCFIATYLLSQIRVSSTRAGHLSPQFCCLSRPCYPVLAATYRYPHNYPCLASTCMLTHTTFAALRPPSASTGEIPLLARAVRVLHSSAQWIRAVFLSMCICSLSVTLANSVVPLYWFSALHGPSVDIWTILVLIPSMPSAVTLLSATCCSHSRGS